MKLFYYKVPTGGNFGDDLNAWLWPKLFPRPLDNYYDDDTLFVGIGTILSHVIPEEPVKKIVFSSGTGYGNPPKTNNNWKIMCVRGPLTADKLGLPADKVITDGALLLLSQFTPGTNRSGIGFMPHHKTAVNTEWPKICGDLGIKYIEPRASVLDVLHELDGLEMLITEAMHGAIVADALRVPWVAVKTRKHILDFKWHDWANSMDINHVFEYLPNPVNSGRQNIINPFNTLIARSKLKKLIQRAKPKISKKTLMDEKYDQLLQCLDNVIRGKWEEL